MAKERKRWVFSPARRRSLIKAQRQHVILVVLGKKAFAKGVR